MGVRFVDHGRARDPVRRRAAALQGADQDRDLRRVAAADTPGGRRADTRPKEVLILAKEYGFPPGHGLPG